MKFHQFAAPFRLFMAALVVIGVCGASALAQDTLSHMTAAGKPSANQPSQANALIQIVRDSTRRFQDVAQAEKEGYALQFGCVSGDSEGAMGLHFVNGELVNSGIIDARHPQIVIYEATPTGLQLIGADYLVLADTWNAKHQSPPELMGQLFHLFDSPNRFGLPAFYTLHVWAWKNNPNGAFVNWHPDVSCQSFNPSAPQ